MKKKYDMPQSQEEQLELIVLIAASPEVAIDTNEVVNAEDVESRRHIDIWDDVE